MAPSAWDPALKAKSLHAELVYEAPAKTWSQVGLRATKVFSNDPQLRALRGLSTCDAARGTSKSLSCFDAHELDATITVIKR